MVISLQANMKHSFNQGLKPVRTISGVELSVKSPYIYIYIIILSVCCYLASMDRSVQMIMWKIWFVYAYNAHKSGGKQHSWSCKTVWIGNYTIGSLSRAITLQSSVCQALFYCGKHTPLQFMQIFQENNPVTEIW